jgi:hypothetical protein
VVHISTCLNTDSPSEDELFSYDKDRMKEKHMSHIRQYFKSTIATSKDLLIVATKVAQTKSSLIDIINGTIEECIATMYELPKFIILETICAKARKNVNNGYYNMIYKKIPKKEKKYIKENILVYGDKGVSNWSLLKGEPPKISVANIRHFFKHLTWLKLGNISSTIFKNIPQVKLDSLFEEGYSYDFYQVKRLRQEKKISLIALVIQHQVLSATDDLIYMITNYVASIEQDSKNEFDKYKLNKFDQSEFLIVKFKDILSDYKKNKSTKKIKIVASFRTK